MKSYSSPREKSFSFAKLSFLIILLLAYSIFFPRAIGHETFVKPVAVTPLTLKESGPTGAFLFRLGDRFGWANEQGELVFGTALVDDLALSDTKYSFYDPKGNALIVMKGEQRLFTLPDRRYSHWSADRLFLMDENRLGAGEVSPAGKILWERTFSSLVTSMSAGKNLAAFGLTSGQLHVLDQDGTLRHSFAPGGSRIPVIYNTSVSPDDRQIALLSGIDPKRFILLERGEKEFRPVHHQNVQDESRFSTPLGFLAEGAYVYFCDGQGLSILNTKDFRKKTLAFSGTLDFIHYEPSNDLVTMVTTTPQGSGQMAILSMDGALLSRAKFPSREVFFKIIGDKLFLGMDGNLLVLEKKEE